MLIPSDSLPTDPNPALAQVLGYWTEAAERAAPASLPRLRHIELMDLHQIAPHLMIADIVRDPPARARYRWRFWGTQLSGFFGIELTGHGVIAAAALPGVPEVR